MAWESKDEIRETIETRKKHVENLVGTLRGIDSQFLARVAELLKKAPGAKGVLQYERLDRTSELYDEELEQQVLDLIDELYSLDNEIYPLHDYTTAEGRKDEWYRATAERIFSQHKSALRQIVGQSKFDQKASSVQQSNLQRIVQEESEKAIGDINPYDHRDPWLQYIVDTYDVNPDDIEPGLFQRALREIALAEYRGDLDRSEVYSIAAKYNIKGKPKEYKKAA